MNCLLVEGKKIISRKRTKMLDKIKEGSYKNNIGDRITGKSVNRQKKLMMILEPDIWGSYIYI